jgi:hypothetical protein
VKVRIVIAGTPGGLEHDDGANIERNPGASFEKVDQAGMAGFHEWREEQVLVSVKPEPEEVGDSENDMSVGNAGDQSSGNEVCPLFGMWLCTGEAKGGFAGKGDAPLLSTIEATILCEPHLLRVPAVQHFLYDLIVVGRVVSWIHSLEAVPVIAKDLLERILVDMLHSASMDHYTANTFSVGARRLAGVIR